MNNSKTVPNRVQIDWVQASDRWVYREYNKDNFLIGANFQQGFDSLKEKHWQVNDPKLLCIIVAITGQHSSLQVSLETLDGLLWRYFDVTSAVDNPDGYYEEYLANL